jgi:Cellulase (glycosyl hydrolase family 5)
MFVPVTEPHGETPDDAGNNALPKQVWNTLYPRLISAIRAEDPERWIIVEPIWGNAINFPYLSVSSEPNLIYSFHFYDPHFFTHQGVGNDWPPAQSVAYPGLTRDASWEPEIYWDKSVLQQRMQLAINFRNTHNVRVICGEFGTQHNAPMDSRERWVTDVADLLETHGFDWMYHEYARLAPGTLQGWHFQRTAYESVLTSKYSLLESGIRRL